MSPAEHEPDDTELDRIDALLARARDGSDVADDVAALAPATRAFVEELLRDLGSPIFAGEQASPSGPGAVLGNYRLVSELGRGGQATVWLAEDLRLSRRVAVKLFRPEIGLSAQGLERIKREALAVSRLHHPGICPVHDTGTIDGQPFLVMAWLEGATLAQRIAQWRAREAQGETAAQRDERVRAVLAIVERCARAIHVAHEAQVVHRDLKPGNIMLAAGDQPVVLDFGLAHVEDTGSATLTRSTDVFGTPAYMSPEQVEPRGRVDARSDVWSLGVTLYEAIALRRPFDAPTRHLLAEAIMRREPARLSALARTSRDLDVVLATALDKDRSRRYGSAAAFADDLRAVLDGRAVAARPVGALARAVRWARRRPVHAALFAVGAIALIGIGGLSGYLAAHRPALQRGVAELRRDDVERLLDVGYFHRAQGSRTSALAAFHAALQEMPDLFEAALGVWLTEVTLGSRAAADAWLAAPSPALPEALVGDLRRGYAERRPLEVDNCADPRTLFAAGILDLALARGDVSLVSTARAVGHFGNCLLASPGSRRLVLFLRAEAAAFALDFDTCRQSVAFIDRNWPGLAESEYWAGVGMLDVDWARAEASFRRAIAIDPNMVAAQRQVARLRARAGDRAEAVALLDRAIALAPDDAETHRFAAEVYEILRDEPAIEAAARRALELDPRRELAGLLLSASLVRRGEFAAAVEALREIVAISPHPGLWVNLGTALDALGETDEAVQCWERALAMPSRNRQYECAARCSLGIAAIDAGRCAEGFAQIERARELETAAKRRWLPPLDEVFARQPELLAQEAALEAWLHKRVAPADPLDCVELAVRRRLFKVAIELVELQPPAANRGAPARVWAACAAVALSATEPDPAAWRARSLAWLRAELAATEPATGGRPFPPSDWRDSPELAPVSDPDAVANLPEVERVAWQELWAAVESR